MAVSAATLLVPSPWAVMLVWNGAWFVAMQARFEEKHLEAMHGDAYRAYAARTGRFVPGIGKLDKA